jgi:hypothetical protein
MTVLVGVETVLLVLMSVLVAGLLRSHAEVLRALHRLGVDLDGAEPEHSHTAARTRSAGAQAYDVSGHTPDGASVHIGVLGGRQSTLLAFLSSGCVTCEPLWEGLRRGEPDLPDRARVVAVTRGAGQESPAGVRALAPDGVPVVMSDAAWEDYGVPGAPYFVYVDGTSVAGEGAARDWRQLASLLERAQADAAPSAA